MSVNIFDDFIMEFEQVCPDMLCDEIIHLFESDDFKKCEGTVGSGIQKQLKISVDGHFDLDIPYQNELCNKMIKIINEGKNLYIKKCKELGIDTKLATSNDNDPGINIIESLVLHSGESIPQIQRTDEGGFFNWHTDFSPHEPRVLAYIIYLNDMEDGAGGDTCFISGKCIKPKKGKLLIFPASLCYLHKGEMVKRDFKYIITSFSVFLYN
jgi:hypothetical protein